jgi:hypothetical protein
MGRKKALRYRRQPAMWLCTTTASARPPTIDTTPKTSRKRTLLARAVRNAGCSTICA